MIDTYINNTSKHNQSAWFIDNYLSTYDKNRQIELVIKVGFFKVAEYLFENKSCTWINEGRIITEILGMDRNSFKLLREFKNPEIEYLKIIQGVKLKGMTLNKDDIITLAFRIRHFSYLDNYLDLMRFTTLHKITKFIDKITPKDQSSYRAADRDYFDYIKWLKELEYDLGNKFNLFPTNFSMVHDRVMEEYKDFSDEKKKKELARAKVVIRQMMKDYSKIPATQFKAYGLMIMVPETAQQIKNEGQQLHHCVGTYVEKVAKGETIILFVRKETEPDKPYFPLEWNGKVVQCRGLYNCSMIPEVERFVNEFEAGMISWSNKKSNKRRKAG